MQARQIVARNGYKTRNLSSVYYKICDDAFYFVFTAKSANISVSQAFLDPTYNPYLRS